MRILISAERTVKGHRGRNPTPNLILFILFFSKFLRRAVKPFADQRGHRGAALLCLSPLGHLSSCGPSCADIDTPGTWHLTRACFPPISRHLTASRIVKRKHWTLCSAGRLWSRQQIAVYGPLPAYLNVQVTATIRYVSRVTPHKIAAIISIICILRDLYHASLFCYMILIFTIPSLIII